MTAVLDTPTGAADPDLRPLSAREAQILDLVADGLPNAGIAARLGLSVLTVKSHLRRIGAALGVYDREAMVWRAYRLGILRPQPWQGPVPALKPGQASVLELIARGLPNATIGRRLATPEDTVKSRVQSLRRVLGAVDRTHLVRRAVDAGLLPVGPPAAPPVAVPAPPLRCPRLLPSGRRCGYEPVPERRDRRSPQELLAAHVAARHGAARVAARPVRDGRE